MTKEKAEPIESRDGKQIDDNIDDLGRPLERSRPPNDGDAHRRPDSDRKKGTD